MTHNLNKNRIAILLIVIGLAIVGVIATQALALYDSYKIGQQQTTGKITELFNQGINDYKKRKADTLRAILKEMVEEDNHFTARLVSYGTDYEASYSHLNDVVYSVPLKPKEIPLFKENHKGFFLNCLNAMNIEQLMAIVSVEDYQAQRDKARLIGASDLTDRFDAVAMTRVLKPDLWMRESLSRAK